MKLLGILLLCILSMSAAQRMTSNLALLGLKQYEDEENDVKAAMEIVGGVFVGAFASYTSIKSCFDDTKGIFTDFKNSFSALKTGTQDSVTDGMIHIGRAMLKIPDAVKDCKDVGNIVNKIKALATKFSNPSLLVVIVGKNILWHSISIYQEVNQAIDHFQKEKWFNFGVSVGVIIDLVFLQMEKNRQHILKTSGSEFMQGFSYGASPFAYMELEECLGDLENDVLERISVDIADLDLDNIEQSIADIRDMTTEFAEVIKDCDTDNEEVKILEEKISKALESDHFVKIAMKIIKSPEDFGKIIEEIDDTFEKYHFFATGNVIGDFVSKVINAKELSSKRVVKESL